MLRFRPIKEIIMSNDFSGSENRVPDQSPAPHKFMARRQQRARTIIWLISTVILVMLLLAIILGDR
jgi:hypothetical protein